jgi:hypothetical protein
VTVAASVLGCDGETAFADRDAAFDFLMGAVWATPVV